MSEHERIYLMTIPKGFVASPRFYSALREAVIINGVKPLPQKIVSRLLTEHEGLDGLVIEVEIDVSVYKTEKRRILQLVPNHRGEK